MTEFKYPGSELELFATVHNWKSYWSSRIWPFISGDVLEVGAGIGSNTPYLKRANNTHWVCLEPDPNLAAQLRSKVEQEQAFSGCEVACGTLQTLDEIEFDTIIYIDVLEHIENDRRELEVAAKLLRSAGRLIVVAPAHQWLFTAFDAAIGHFRRYNRSMLRDITPAVLSLEHVWYLDSAGLLLSAANRSLLRQSMPTKAQLRFWDKYVIPVSEVIDRCAFDQLGKSIVGIWKREKV